MSSKAMFHVFALCFLANVVVGTAFTINESTTSMDLSGNTNVEINDASHPLNTSDVQTAISLDESQSLSIRCGETKSGTNGDSPHSVLLHFVNQKKQDVTVTDCDTEFDAKVFLMDSNGTYIQNQSTNDCDGNDCENTDICSTPNRETFTMQSLDAGSYTLKLTPYSFGGIWTVKVICSEPSIYADVMYSDDTKC